MTRTVPTPEHATPARYRGTRTGSRPPCHCRPCVDAHTRACARRDVQRLAGHPLRVPSGPVTTHVRQLLAAGMSRAQIAIAAGVSRASVANAATGKNPTFNRTVADKILAVRPCIVRDTDLIPAIGTRRRIQALYSIGHGALAISNTTGLTTTAIQKIAHGASATVTAATYKQIRAAYRRLVTTPGTSARAKAVARVANWQPPTAWGDDIDHPDARPEDDVPPAIGFRELAAIRREEIIHLAWCGDTPEQILNRLDGEVSISTVRQIVHEWRTGQRRDRKQAA